MKHARADLNGRIVDLAEPAIRGSFGLLGEAINTALPVIALASREHADAIGLALAQLGQVLYGGAWITGQSWEEWENAGHHPIPDNEPVFLVRAQDKVGPWTVRSWATLHAEQGGDLSLCDTANLHAIEMDRWPVKKLAD